MTRLRILTYDSSTQSRIVIGRKLRDYPLGAVTVEDDRGIVYFATKDRILPMMTLPGVTECMS